MTRLRAWREQGLWFPAGIALGLTVMVLWNMVFISMALRTAPEVDPAWTHAVDR